METHWFFDLEDTLIDSWASGLLVHTSVVREFLQRYDIRGFHIFSFAVWNERDRATFDQDLRQLLERTFQVQILTCPTLEDFREATLEQAQMAFSASGYCQQWGKVRAFQDYVRHHGFDGRAVLVDEMVPTASTVERQSGHVIEYVNVSHLEQWTPLTCAAPEIILC